jgi:hypothetical protein
MRRSILLPPIEGGASQPDDIGGGCHTLPGDRRSAVKYVLFYDAAADMDRARAVFQPIERSGRSSWRAASC